MAGVNQAMWLWRRSSKVEAGSAGDEKTREFVT